LLYIPYSAGWRAGITPDVPASFASTDSVMEFGNGNVFSIREMIGRMIRKWAK
jgi:hypothetical protein